MARVPTRIRVIDAATDVAILVIAMPGPIEWGILDFAATGIEVGQFSSQGIGATLPGVWSVNPGTGVVTKISDGYDPPTARWISSGSRIIHRDPTGHMTTWLDLPGYGLGFIPFAGDSSVLVAATWFHPDQNPSFGADLWLVRAPGDAVKLLSNVYPTQYNPDILGSPFWPIVQEVSYSTGPLSHADDIVDEHGIWLAYAMLADGGRDYVGPEYVGNLFLVTPAGAILHVDNRPLFPAGSCA